MALASNSYGLGRRCLIMLWRLSAERFTRVFAGGDGLL